MNEDNRKTHEESSVEREIREDRKFSLEEAIARMAGPGAMKGVSPVARMRQAEIEIGAWLRTHICDAGGALEVVLHRDIKGSELFLNNYEHPMVVLRSYLQDLLASEYHLSELVRNADIEWGRVMGERPYFEKAGASAQAEDPYTIESVRRKISGLLEQLTMHQ